ncbi:MAG: hypothetical protein KDC12_14825, partial [Flavobacteriales bacterium]|nr:hypothetical protein [Flavobacteriales bacterium]
MKNIKHSISGVLLLCGVAVAHLANAQCNGGHSTDPTDAWISCTGTENPNPARTQEHWIMYDFANLYALEQSIVWNYNVPGDTDKGIKTIIIDTSTNGTSWNEWGTIVIDEAPGQDTYEGEMGPDFNGVAARYVLISVVDNWGDASCQGFAEIKFNIG